MPVRGPALLVCNHLSHIDGLLVGAGIPRSVRFMVFKTYSEDAALNWLMRPLNPMPIGDRGEVSRSVERARDELRQGHVVCIFAEGAISRTGNLLPFTRGFERIADGLDVPLIPVYLDQVRACPSLLDPRPLGHRAEPGSRSLVREGVRANLLAGVTLRGRHR